MKTKVIKKEITDIINYISAFYKNPFLNVKKVPSWSWLSLFILISVFASLTGLIRGIFSGSFLQSIIGFLFLPLTSVICIGLLAFLFYFLVVVFQNRNLNFKRLTTLIAVSLLPTISIYALSLIHPTLVILGLTFSFLLIAFGMIHRFQLNKKFVWLSVGLTFTFIFMVWIFSYLNLNSDNRTQQFINQESHKILKNELAH